MHVHLAHAFVVSSATETHSHFELPSIERLRRFNYQDQSLQLKFTTLYTRAEVQQSWSDHNFKLPPRHSLRAALRALSVTRVTLVHLLNGASDETSTSLARTQRLG